MVAYLNRMPAGIPGEVSRPGATLESQLVGDTPIAFGSAVKISSGVLSLLEEGDSAADVYGFLTRIYPTSSIGATADFGAGSAPAGTLQSVMRRGYMSVELKIYTAADAAKAGAVYVRTGADEGRVVGDIEAAPGDGLAAVPGCIFMGGADPEGAVEISFNI